jgi:trk system potassium uptake protein
LAKPFFTAFTSSNEDLAGADSVAVIGLGRFGAALALELMATGTEVLGIDNSAETVQALNGKLTHVVRADSTNEEALRQLSVHEFDRAVVAIGTDLEASILTTSLLLRFGIKMVWAKAISAAHGQILEQLGVKHVVYPEHDMGRRVAHLVRGAMEDYVEVDPGFVMVKTVPPREIIGVPLANTKIRDKYGVAVVAYKPRGLDWTYPIADTVIEETDTILIAGGTRDAEHFSQLR